ncbi:MAG: 23S rRNA (guanosine(2251)-2'-O)-methyltransferase RlmB [Bacteroidetes bacterium]|nr:23S rRNA (guanosine(2251)-2'-O)-methyltransferase RlmB [Bacteroidota bacterium]HET6245827.1 23S rRNA (guanosine(2251)-2'-O)-methyltransferase RlmB [Bacteroidia bacterium]
MNYRNQEEKSQLIFGIRPIIEAVNSGKEIEKVLIQPGLKGDNFGDLKHLLNKKNIPVQYVPQEKLNRVTSKNHQGVIAYVAPIVFGDIENIIPEVYEKGKQPFVLILDRITDVRNFGAIVRTAECAGVDAIVIPSKGSAQINADALKTSAGALFKMPVCRVENLKAIIDFLKDSGLDIIACTEKTDQLFDTVNYTKPLAIIMGSEEDGISPEYLKRADYKTKIPLLGSIGSLNVSVAAGVILFEAVRQRLKAV